MKSNKRTNSAANTFTSSTWAICACLALCFAVDAGVALTLIITGMSSQLMLVPLVSAVVDVVFFVFALVSNFRFKYGLIGFLAYIIAYSLISLLAWYMRVNESVHYMTNAAQIAWLIVHLFAIVMTLATYLYAAKNNKSKLSATIAVSVALFVMALAAGAYGIYYGRNGYLGQGFEGVVRPIEYIYDKTTDSYEALGLMEGNGDTVVISDTYNSKPVTRVDCNMFADPYIKNIKFEGEVTYELTGIAQLANVNSNLNIVADKDSIDDVKDLLYATAKTNALYAKYAFDFANIITPSNLDDNQVYVTFGYSVDSFNRLDGKVLDTWIGTKGTVFHAQEYENEQFFLNSDPTNDEQLDWNFKNNDKHIFGGLKANGVSLVGKPINESCYVAVEFEKIYRVYAGDSNDSLYLTAEHFPTSEVSGQSLGYKYTVASIADTLLDTLPVRNGFTLSWKYTTSTLTTQTAVTSLRTQLQGYTLDDVNLYPQWSMTAPTLSVSTTAAGNSVTYGEEISFVANATAADSNFTLSYNWTRANGPSWTESNATATIAQIPFEAYGAYTCTVISSVEDSSLTASVTKSVTITVTPRQLTVNWDDSSLNKPDGTQIVYSGANQTVSCSLVEQPLSGDLLSLALSVNGEQHFDTNLVLRNAGRYTATVTLDGAAAHKYRIASGATKTYDVAKAAAEVTWSAACSDGEEHVYNAQGHGYTATVQGVGADYGLINLTYTYSSDSSDMTNAGSYTIYAHLPQEYESNYTLTNDSKPFTIGKAMATFAWDDTQSYTYDGDAHKPTATATGVNGVSLQLTITVSGGAAVNVGTYTATAALTNSTDINNYNLTSESKQFVIAAKEIFVTWDSDSFVYNGEEQLPKVTSIPLAAEGDSLALVDELNNSRYVNGSSINVDSYSVTVTLTNNNYVFANQSKSFEIPYEIRPSSIFVTGWSDGGSISDGYKIIYDGKEHVPHAFARDMYSADDQLTVTIYSYGSSVATSAVNVAKYTAKATASANYEILGGDELIFEIIPRKAIFKVVAPGIDNKYTERPDIEDIKQQLACIVDGDGLADAHVSTVVYFYVSNDKGDDGYLTITAQATIRDASGNDVMSNYDVSYTPLTITLREVQSETEQQTYLQFFKTSAAWTPMLKEVQYVL